MEAPIKNAAASVKEVTVIATPACFIACVESFLQCVIAYIVNHNIVYQNANIQKVFFHNV